MGPINYLPQNQPGLLQEFANMYQVGAGIRQIQQQQEQQQLAQRTLAEYQTDLQTTMQNPTAESFGKLALKYPGQREAIIASSKLMNEAQQTSVFNDASKIFNALNIGNNDAALKIATLKRDALKNAGRDTSDYDAMIESINTDPKAAQATVGLIGSSIDPKKWTDTFKAAPEIEEAQSKAAQAAAKAKFAASEAALDLQKKNWDITKIQEDIKIAKENSKIAALNAQISKEGNELKRKEIEIKLQESKDKRDEAVRTKAAELESANFNIDNMLNTIERVLKNPSLDSVVGSIEGRLPALLSDEESDAIAMIETLGSQAFLSQIPQMKGAGTISNAEGEKLQSSFQNLSRAQSLEQFIANLKEGKRLLLKGRKTLANKYGLPQTVPDTPAAPPQPDKTVEKSQTKKESVTVGNKVYYRPDNFTDAQWNSYKQSVGAK